MAPALPLILRQLPLVILALAAFWLRTLDLAKRPMHADEANQAVKLGELLDAGHYAFDPRDHHGPTLYYAAVPIAWLRGEHSLATLTESTVRLVPAFFGTLTVVLVALLAAPLGRWPALTAAAFVAVSPPAVYYSRYFIQETLLVAFTLALFLCYRKWRQHGLARWAVGGGVALGLMQATKASAPLFVAAALVALWVEHFWSRGHTSRVIGGGLKSALPHACLAAGAALVTAAVLYSAFGSNPGGIRDALSAYGHAFTRFGAAAAPSGHEKPWWYYLRLFGWHKEGGLVWHQAPFSALVAVGVMVAFARRERFLRGVAVYAFVIVTLFSVFAYKTPWHAVHFVPAFAVIAAGTVAAISRLLTGRLVAIAFALIVIMTLYQQSWRVSFLRPADQRNPYAYVHSSADVLKYRARAESGAAQFPDRPIRVIAEEYWPLPWYLRGLPRVAYYSAPPDDCDGALVIVSASQAEAVRARLHGPYHESFLGLRPGFLCILFTPEP